jgi:hypothetical protein
MRRRMVLVDSDVYAAASSIVSSRRVGRVLF